ncbi:cyclophilin family peptidyl-prolyl cis-trans isomerase [Dipodascopsis uninucleata]
MSSALEPPTTAKVILHTTKGPIEVELWAKETPLACRNFLQHCMDGYYDNTIFHRVVPDFLVQAGDPTGTGHGGQSIYSSEGGFPSEFHSRLRFNRRGLLGNAEAESQNDNSQFFITLAATPELQRKHTLFGRVVGETIYNVLKISEVELNEDGRPLYPTKISHTEILVNYFSDMKPRQLKTLDSKQAKLANSSTKKKLKTRPKVKLTYGDDEEEEEGLNPTANKKSKKTFKMRSAHEILNDSRLVQFKLERTENDTTIIRTGPTCEENKTDSGKGVAMEEKTEQKTTRKHKSDSEVSSSNYEKGTPLQDSQPEIKAKKESIKSSYEEDGVANESFDVVGSQASEFDKINAEIAALKASMKRKREGSTSEKSQSKKKISALEEQRLKYLQPKQSGISAKKRKEQREAATLSMLSKFTSKLHDYTKARPPPLPKRKKASDGDEEELCELHNLPRCQSCMYYDQLSDGEEGGSTYLFHTFGVEENKKS